MVSYGGTLGLRWQARKQTTPGWFLTPPFQPKKKKKHFSAILRRFSPMVVPFVVLKCPLLDVVSSHSCAAHREGYAWGFEVMAATSSARGGLGPEGGPHAGQEPGQVRLLLDVLHHRHPGGPPLHEDRPAAGPRLPRRALAVCPLCATARQPVPCRTRPTDACAQRSSLEWEWPASSPPSCQVSGGCQAPRPPRAAICATMSDH